MFSVIFPDECELETFQTAKVIFSLWLAKLQSFFLSGRLSFKQVRTKTALISTVDIMLCGPSFSLSNFQHYKSFPFVNRNTLFIYQWFK